MSTLGIFVMGTIVSMLVGGALWLLLWGAVMDGREDDSGSVTSAEAQLLGSVVEQAQRGPALRPR
jgi:hypothetical protein